MKDTKLALRKARRLALRSQGLIGRQNYGRGRKAVVSALEHLGYLQIDTIAVVQRAHHLALRARIPGYRPTTLYALLEEGKSIFEYWAHAAAFLPLRDFRYSLVRKQAFASGKNRAQTDRKTLDYVLDRIRGEGPLSAADFAAPPNHGKSTWWNWKPAKKALEYHFMAGTLMVKARKNFQKVYDLRERVLPEGVDTTLPDSRELYLHYIRSALRAHGIATAGEMCYLRRPDRKAFTAALSGLVEEGDIVALGIPELPGHRYYAFAAELEQAARPVRSRALHILSPFDNVLIQRRRLEELFGFRYQLECYVPAAKRSYGYFVLPLLWSESFVGRMDAKAERSSGLLKVLNLVFEPGQEIGETLLEALAGQIIDFAAFNGCSKISVEKVSPAKLRAPLRRLIRARSAEDT